MKKLSFMMVAAGLLATSALSSCTKEEVKSTSQTSNTKNNAAALSRMGGHWVKFYEKDPCAGSGGDCYELDPIVVRPKIFDDIAAAATSGNSGVVGTTFSSPDLQDICNNMGTLEVAKLQSGNYFITVNYENSVLINYMAGQSFPVTAQNMEFSFQIFK